MNFTKVSEARVGDVNAAVYELDHQHQEELEARLKNKIRKMRIHRGVIDDELTDLLSPFATPEFKASIETYSNEATSPWRNPRIDLDVRRSRVTEFMSQILLEKEYGCLFYESTDKRVNLNIYEADKHVAGVDVTGLKGSASNFRFVVCEVKSTRSTTVGANVDKLLQDISDAYDDKGSTLSREILASIQQIRNDTNIGEDEIGEIVKFLVNALSMRETKEAFLEKIIFFPFMVKQNMEATTLSIPSELRVFADKSFPNTEMHGVIWSFGKTLNEFCNDIYESATS